MKPQIAVCISGNGSNLQALIDAAKATDYPGELALVISNKPDAYGLTRALDAGIPIRILPHADYPERAAFDDALNETLAACGIDIVCLAGFMRLLTPGFALKWQGRIINIHPSLLPLFKGLHTHRQALQAGVKLHGCSVHHVVPDMDAGPLVAQAAVPVQAGDTPETLAARVLQAEHLLYPCALAWLLDPASPHAVLPETPPGMLCQLG